MDPLASFESPELTEGTGKTIVQKGERGGVNVEMHFPPGGRSANTHAWADPKQQKPHSAIMHTSDVHVYTIYLWGYKTILILGGGSLEEVIIYIYIYIYYDRI